MVDNNRLERRVLSAFFAVPFFVFLLHGLGLGSWPIGRLYRGVTCYVTLVIFQSLSVVRYPVPGIGTDQRSES